MFKYHAQVESNCIVGARGATAWGFRKSPSNSNSLCTLAYTIKAQDAEFFISCNRIGGNQRPLYLQPECEAALSSSKRRVSIHHYANHFLTSLCHNELSRIYKS